MTNEQERFQGKIAHLDEGWGFITAPKHLKYTRIFFYWSALVHPLKFDDLQKGMEVEFVAKEDPLKGWRAFRISLPGKYDEHMEPVDER